MTNLYIDPHTRRIAYLSEQREFPSKVMILDRGCLLLFTPDSLEKLIYEGALPLNLNAQTCWNFKVTVEGCFVAA